MVVNHRLPRFSMLVQPQSVTLISCQIRSLHSLTTSAATTMPMPLLLFIVQLYTGLPVIRWSCLGRNAMLRSAVRLIGKIPKCDHVTRYTKLYMQATCLLEVHVLHWLHVRQRIEQTYRVVSLVQWCLLSLAPAHLIDLCQPVSCYPLQRTRSLRSAERRGGSGAPVCPCSLCKCFNYKVWNS